MPATASSPGRLVLGCVSAVVAAMLALVPAGGAWASASPADTLAVPVAPHVSLSAGEGQAGDPITLSGSCLLVDDETGAALARGDVLDVGLTRNDGVDAWVWQSQAPVADDGSVDFTFEVPSEVHPGIYALIASCSGGDEWLGGGTFDFTVLAPPNSTPPGSIDAPSFFVDSELSLLPSRARAGELITLSGACLLTDSASGAVVMVGESLYVSLVALGAVNEMPFRATVPVADDGVVELTFAVPDDLPPGTYTVFAMCTTDDQAFGGGRYELTVLAPALPPGPSTPATGASSAVAPVSQPSGGAAPSAPSPIPAAPASSPSAGASSDLAETGAPAGRSAAVVALGLILGGAGLLLARRRRLVDA